jgi:hypothetical protein
MAATATGNLGNYPSLAFQNIYGGFSAVNNPPPPSVPAASTGGSFQPTGSFGSTASFVVLIGALVAIRLLYEYAG